MAPAAAGAAANPVGVRDDAGQQGGHAGEALGHTEQLLQLWLWLWLWLWLH
jgi:hypothetical protein